MGKEKKLTPKQKLFCEEYLIDLNGTKAAIRAGYSEKTSYSIACENLIKPEIKNYIAELQSNRSKEVGVDAEWVLKRFVEISNKCMTAEPVMKMIDGQLEETGEYKFDSTGANKATEMVGKHIGFFEKDNGQKNVIITPVMTKEQIKHLNDEIENDY
jgi:phage terminase small subunit